jgi:2-aminoethylphosphonate-pyruvate transaminase
MPVVDSAATVERWATERAILAWAIFESDLNALGPARVADAVASVEADGGCLVSIPGSPDGPRGLFDAVISSGVSDVRRFGVLCNSVAAADAAHRAGAGAIVGIIANEGERQALLEGQPDLIVTLHELADTDAERFGSRRVIRELALLNPGPAVVSDRIHRAIGGPDLCHREPEYTTLFARVRKKLLRVADLPDTWGVVLISGSGTAAMEAMTGSIVREGKKLLVCRNGHYGERIATIAERYRIPFSVIDEAATVPIDPAAVAQALDADPEIDALVVIQHETTSGLLNPVQAIAAEADKRGVLTAVDAISAFGAEDLDAKAWGVDVVAGTSNKNLHGLPGVCFLLLSPRAIMRAKESPRRSLYFDVPAYLAAQERSSVPYTPAVPATYGLDAALDELLDEGIDERRRRYRERAEILDAGLARLGLEPVVAPEHRSTSVRSMPMPEGIAYAPLHDALKRHGWVVYAGLGPLAATNFRICALGALEPAAIEGFIDLLGSTIDELRKAN